MGNVSLRGDIEKRLKERKDQLTELTGVKASYSDAVFDILKTAPPVPKRQYPLPFR